MFDTVCTIPLISDLFTQAVHPKEPIVSVGLASGHVYTYRLPPGGDEEEGDTTLLSEAGYGQVETAWKTRRHKGGSCRTLGFGYDGEQLYSAGTDGIVKVADVSTGQVTSKILIPTEQYVLTSSRVEINGLRLLAFRSRGESDDPTTLHALTPQTLLVSTESGALHIYDIRERIGSKYVKPQQTHYPHDDYISSITPLPPSAQSTSGMPKQWVSVGGTTLAVTDLRRGVLVKSESQEDELLSSVMVTGLSSRGTSVGEKVLVGGSTGVLTLWERGVWDDQDERIIVDKQPGGGEPLESIALLPPGVGTGGKIVAVGLGNGEIKFVKIGPNKVVAELKHDELTQESVFGLGFDVTGRMISGGGKMLKVWHEKVPEQYTSVIGPHDSDESDAEQSDSEKDSDEEMEDSSEDEKESKKRKKRKRNKGKQTDNGIVGFSGLD
jgi:WD40 repeat protein